MLGSRSSFSRRLLRWYDRWRRDLPWRAGPGRPGPLDPYHVLVSETMLQQTQVATVIPYFYRFVRRFPTLCELAAADEQELLRLWQGLGYYSRARNLRDAARKVMSEFGGNLPTRAGDLLNLPGVGRYTAGAIASIAFEQRAAILDGNVTRVICRLDQVTADPRKPSIREQLWERARVILPRRRVGDFNSALMELGATVCTPRNPKCDVCPVRRHCQAKAAGVQHEVPVRRRRKSVPHVRRRTFCLCHRGRWLIEQRPPTGRWAGMWQFVTLDGEGPVNGAAAALPVSAGQPVAVGVITHALTHRRYTFDVFIARARSGKLRECGRRRAWVTLAELAQYPLPRPHLKIIELLGKRPEVDD